MHVVSKEDLIVLAACTACLGDVLEGTVDLDDVRYLLGKLHISDTDIRQAATEGATLLNLPRVPKEDQAGLLDTLRNRAI